MELGWELLNLALKGGTGTAFQMKQERCVRSSLHFPLQLAYCQQGTKIPLVRL